MIKSIAKRLCSNVLTVASVALGLAFAVACQPELETPQEEEGIIEVTFHPSLDEGVGTKAITEAEERVGSKASTEAMTKAIGDAAKVDQLRAAVYQEKADGLELVSTQTKSWKEVQKNGVSLKLSAGNSYKILFWAEDQDNTAYKFLNDGSVKADYTDYLTGGFARMEELDAFYATALISPESPADKQKSVVLRRPVAQLNFFDETMPEPGTHTAKVTFHSVPTSFNPFTGQVKATNAADSSDDLTFIFSDFPTETLKVDGTDYNYLTCNYILAATEGRTQTECTIEVTKAGLPIVSYEFKGKKAIALTQRRKTNVAGPIVQDSEKWSDWNGQFPIVSTITADPNDPDCYLIDDAEDIAWLGDASNAARLGENKTFKLMTNIDMCHKPGQKSMKLPAGSSFDGNGYTIKGLKLMIGLFGDTATDLDVKNLIIDDAIVSSTTRSHRGILVNSLYGSGSVSNIWITNSYVNTIDGVAGGLIGYISRKGKTDRSEKLEVVFDNCHVINTVIEGSDHAGYFVGVFRGYDHNEVLRFKNSCSCTPSPDAAPLHSNFVEGMECIWLEKNDYSAYNAWLGAEECYRGTVLFEDMRFVPKWDGKTFVSALLADPEYDDTADHKVVAGPKRYVIYSSYDLAGMRTKTSAQPYAVYFLTDVDLNGAGADGITYVDEEFEYSAADSEDDNYFNPIHSIDTLEGYNHTVYNMNINHKVETGLTGSAFITKNRTGAKTIHRDLNFRNCNTVVKSRPYEDVDGRLQDMSTGSIFLHGSFVSDTTSYAMENIHVYDSRVFAIQSIGIISHNFQGNMTNCTVNNCYIENYRVQDNLELFSHTAEFGAGNVRVEAEFYSYGEVGGLIGMLRNVGNITNCHVRGTTIRAYGQEDKEATLTGEGLFASLAVSAASAAGYFLIPGRHVSTLIGDIRSAEGKTINISNCTVDSNTKCYPRLYSHSANAPFIGQAYFIQYLDTEGPVYVDGKKLTLADCNRNTTRQ